MTAASLSRLERSFEQLGPNLHGLTASFYTRLFATEPHTRELFTIDMPTQRKHFASALALVVRNLRVLDALEQPLRDLGARHARAGVSPQHYPPFVEAMLFALAEALGPAWDDELAADWSDMLNRIASHMLVGATKMMA